MMRMATSRSTSITSTTSTTSSTSTPHTKAALFAQYHRALLVEFTNNIRENINIRLDAIQDIVNVGLPDNFEQFVINTDVRNNIMAKIEPEIDDKTKVQHKSCTKQINNIKDYRNVARNRLNRNKPKFLGNFVFGEIIFNMLYPHIYKQCRLHQLQSTQIMRYFISILITIFENHAQFTQTKPQPIITYNTLVNQNLFLSGCINLLKRYQIPPNLYETEKRKPKKNKTPKTNKPKEPAKRDKAKMAYQKIVDAMKLINTEEKLTSVDVPQHIITNNDARKNKTYQATCITPPAFPEAEEIYTFTQPQYIPPNVPVMPQISQIPQISQAPQLPQLPPLPRLPPIPNNNVSFGSSSCSNMPPYTHFGQDIHSNSSSSGDELSASTNSGDRDTQNVSFDDSGMSREYSSSSASNSIHTPEHIDHVGYGANNINNNFGLDQRQNINIAGYDNYQPQQCQQNEYPVIPTLAGLPASSNDNVWTLNNNNQYQTTPTQQLLQQRQQSHDMFYGNNNNGIMTFNDEYKTMTQSGYNACIENNNNYTNFTFNNNNINTTNFNLNNNGNINGNMIENIDVNRDKQFGVMISGADFNNNPNVHSNNYNISQPSQPSFQYQPQQQQQPAPFINSHTQKQPEMAQYIDGHHNNFTVNRNNDNMNMFIENNNNTAVTVTSTNNQFSGFGFDNNSMANSNVNTFGCFDNNSLMNNMNNLSQNQSVAMPTMIDDISPNTINSGYSASRGRSRSNNVRSLRFSPLALPQPRTQPMTISNPFPFNYTSTNNNNSGSAVNSNNNMVPVPFVGHQNNNYGY